MTSKVNCDCFNGAVPGIAGNGSRLGEVVDFEKLSLKFITKVK